MSINIKLRDPSPGEASGTNPLLRELFKSFYYQYQTLAEAREIHDTYARPQEVSPKSLKP